MRSAPVVQDHQVIPRPGGTHQLWVATSPVANGHLFSSGPYPSIIAGVRGQLEKGEGGLVHYQVLIRASRPVRRTQLSTLFPGTHLEPSRSAAARDYVWKEDTRIGDPFEWGCTLPPRRNSETDWESIRRSAKRGDLESIPADVYVRSYNSLRRICADHVQPPRREVICQVIVINIGLLGGYWLWKITPCLGRSR
jgi:hypothetical protein